MTGKDLLAGLSYVDEALLAEAGEVIFAEERGSKGAEALARSAEADRRQVSCKECRGFAPWHSTARRGFVGTSRGWRMLGVAAACFCLVIVAAAGMDFFDNGAPAGPEQTAVTIQMEDITVNQLTAEGSEDVRRWNLPNGREIQWTESDIEEHFGRSLTPAYVPEGLQPSARNGEASVWADKDGKLLYDMVSVDYYHAYNPDGMPAWTDGAAAEKGFTLTAAKDGIWRDFSWLSDEDEREASVIGGTEVVIGHRLMDYGPYDEKSHEPAGYYDLYVADFQLGDVSYEVVSHQLPLEEVVKIVTSFICETDDIELK